VDKSQTQLQFLYKTLSSKLKTTTMAMVRNSVVLSGKFTMAESILRKQHTKIAKAYVLIQSFYKLITQTDTSESMQAS
jgi:hypothetical protein